MKHVVCGTFYFDNTSTFEVAKKAAEEHCALVKSLREKDENFVRVKVIQKSDHFLVDLKLTN